LGKLRLFLRATWGKRRRKPVNIKSKRKFRIEGKRGGKTNEGEKPSRINLPFIRCQAGKKGRAIKSPKKERDVTIPPAADWTNNERRREKCQE